MVLNAVGTVQTGFPGFFDDGQKVAKLGVFQRAGEFARGPEFRTSRTDTLDALEGVAGAGTGNWSLIDFLLPEAMLQLKAGTRSRSVEI